MLGDFEPQRFKNKNCRRNQHAVGLGKDEGKDGVFQGKPSTKFKEGGAKELRGEGGGSQAARGDRMASSRETIDGGG